MSRINASMLNTILCLLRIVHGFGYYNEDRWTVFKYHIFCVGNAEYTLRYYEVSKKKKKPMEKSFEI